MSPSLSSRLSLKDFQPDLLPTQSIFSPKLFPCLGVSPPLSGQQRFRRAFSTVFTISLPFFRFPGVSFWQLDPHFLIFSRDRPYCGLFLFARLDRVTNAELDFVPLLMWAEGPFFLPSTPVA